MKVNTTKNNQIERQAPKAFTLIEMIGVLAVIAILAAMLVPKVFSAINDSRVNNAVVSAETVKTAIADHYGKYGAFNSIFGTNTFTTTPYTGYDTNVLMAEGLIDKPFLPKIGTSATIRLTTCPAAGTTAIAATDGSYSLDGSGTNNVFGQYVVDAVIYGVSVADAQAVSSRIDGATLSQPDVTSTDTKGRVKYAYSASSGTTDIYIYLTHR
jgi:prepilin-type N-terminal cleavage/methylation domain-containing protein